MERTSSINIGGQSYSLLLTTRATKEIAKRFCGLTNLGDKLSNTENFEEALDDLIWLIVTLANQSIMIENLKGANKKLLTAEEVELLTVPSDLGEYKDAIANALINGTKRFVESEPEKN